jgi:hypothetical protein
MRSLLACLVIAVAACGGAINNEELFQKDDQTASGTPTPGGSASPSPTSSPTTAPTNVTPPTPKPSTKCDVSFKNDVIGVLAAAKCSTITCHGGPAPFNQPGIDTDSAPSAYKTLTSFKLSGKAYVAVGSTDPKASAIRCNLRGDCGTSMPPGDRLPSADLDVIDAWLACGAPFN